MPADQEARFLESCKTAPVRALGARLGDRTFEDWLHELLGAATPLRWEVNDCGEASGSAADSARDLPVCVETFTTLSGGRELFISIAVGTVTRGPVKPPEFSSAGVTGPDTAFWFSGLSEIERFVDQERPALRDRKVYVDKRRNVHVVTPGNRDVPLTKDGRYEDPKLAPDGQSIGFLALSTVNREVGQASEPIEVAEEVCIYRGGRVIRRLQAGGFIRAWGFANGGAAVAVYSGGLHFAGFYELFDLETGSILDQAKDPVTDRSPAWVRDLSP